MFPRGVLGRAEGTGTATHLGLCACPSIPIMSYVQRFWVFDRRFGKVGRSFGEVDRRLAGIDRTEFVGGRKLTECRCELSELLGFSNFFCPKQEVD